MASVISAGICCSALTTPSSSFHPIGLPEPREDHAVAMSRFAQACMTKMKEVVADLEVTLGPDTGDLTMRFGLHS